MVNRFLGTRYIVMYRIGGKRLLSAAVVNRARETGFRGTGDMAILPYCNIASGFKSTSN